MKKDDVLTYIRERYTYDAETGTIRHKGKDRPVKGGTKRDGYLNVVVGPKNHQQNISFHRMAWALYYGRWPLMIDHINGDPTDNRLCNLREVSHKENLTNRLLQWIPNTRTGLPGVCVLAFKGKILGYVVGSTARNHTFSDKYEAFFASVMLGHMFKD